MASRQGTLLEQNVENIFNSLGFHTERNIKKKGYEIDVFCKRGETEIIIECKQYEKSSLTIRNLIHQWADKNAEIGADKVILVLYGINIKSSDINLALNRNIILWDEKILQKYTSLVIKDKEEALKKLNQEMNLEKNKGDNKNLRNIEQFKIFIMLKLMAGKNLNRIKEEDDLYGSFISSFKTTLQNAFTKGEKLKQDKEDYAELFSRVEREENNNKEKWENVKKRIRMDNKLFPKGGDKNTLIQEIKDIENVFEKAKNHFDEKDKKKLRYKLVSYALEWLVLTGDEITFVSKKNSLHKIKFIYDQFSKEESFGVSVNRINFSRDRVEKLKWLIDEEIYDNFENEVPIDQNEAYLNFNMELNIKKATKYIEIIFLKFYEEDEDFDINLFLEDSAEDSNEKKYSKGLFWTWIILGIISLPTLFFGLIFFYLAYRENKKPR